MTPKEKAEELVDKFMDYSDSRFNVNNDLSPLYTAKQCALIAVDEILKNDTIFYWKGKYEASAELYKAPRYRDIDYEKEEAFHLLQKIILIAIIILQLSQLK